MSKFLTKVITLITVASLFCSVVGCFNNNDEEDVTKTNLHIGCVTSGYGTKWLYEYVSKFEEKYKDYSFEEGKTGVKVHINVDTPTGSRLSASIGTLEEEIIFDEDVPYYELASQNKLYNISEIVTETFENNNSIESKLLSNSADQYKDYLKINGNYYGIPFNINYYTLIYDVELFDEQGFFFEGKSRSTQYSEAPAATDYEGNYKFTNKNGNLSAGPDGKKGTFDDGLPATYEEYFALCDKISQNSRNGSKLKPVIFSGAYGDMTLSRFLYTLWATNEGYDNMRLNYNLNGTANDLVKLDNTGKVILNGNTPQVESINISSTNGYELNRQVGKYYALQFAEKLLKHNGNTYSYLEYNKSINNGGSDQKEAEYEFLRGKTNGGGYAMLIDGIHWENDAEDRFTALGQTKNDRKFALMPLPFPTNEQIGSETVMFDTHSSYILVNKTVENKTNLLPAIKAFIQGFHTQDSLESFTKTTSLVRPFNYTVDTTSGISYFGKSVCEYYLKSKVVIPGSSNSFVLNHYSLFNPVNNTVGNIWTTQLDSTTKSLISEFHKQKTAKEYFEGIYLYNKNRSEWNS